MQAAVPVSFSWFVAKDGYEIVHDNEQIYSWLVETDSPGAASPDSRRRVYPLEDSPDLFLQLAEVHRDPEWFDDVERFANKYGWLGIGEPIDDDGEMIGEDLLHWFNNSLVIWGSRTRPCGLLHAGLNRPLHCWPGVRATGKTTRR